MSIGKSGLGIPAVLLHDAEGFLVSVETKMGEVYKGILTESVEVMTRHAWRDKSIEKSQVFVLGSLYLRKSASDGYSLKRTKKELTATALLCESIKSEDNFNVHLDNVKYIDANGKESSLKAVFIRGSKIKMIILPELLAHAPVFQRIEKFRESKGKYVPSGTRAHGF